MTQVCGDWTSAVYSYLSKHLETIRVRRRDPFCRDARRWPDPLGLWSCSAAAQMQQLCRISSASAWHLVMQQVLPCQVRTDHVHLC